MIDKSRSIANFGEYTSTAHIFVSASGSEQRSTALLREECISSETTVVFQHTSRESKIAKDNESYIRDRADIILSERDTLNGSENYRQLLQVFENSAPDSLRVLIDISCLTRTMLAEVAVMIRKFEHKVHEVEYLYLPAKFVQPKNEYPKIRRIGASHPDLAGYNADPNLPLALVMGLGFEYGVALGLINQLEPERTICAWASGHDPRFDEAVRKANFDFDFSPYKASTIEYNMFDPVGTMRLLSDVVGVLSSQFRVVLVPMGPKIFSLASTLLSLESDSDLALYRVEHGHNPRDVLPSGELISAIGHPSLRLEPSTVS